MRKNCRCLSLIALMAALAGAIVAAMALLHRRYVSLAEEDAEEDLIEFLTDDESIPAEGSAEADCSED